MSSSRQTPNTKPLLRFVSGTESELLLKILFQPRLPFLSPALTEFWGFAEHHKGVLPALKSIWKGLPTAQPHCSGDSPETSQKATTVLTQRPRQCICSVTPAGEPSLLRRCQISTPSLAFTASRLTNPRHPDKPQQSRFFLLPITALLGATEMKFIPPWAQGDLEP